jgi:hypothetical protein
VYLRALSCVLALGLAACGSDSPTTPSLQTHSYTATLTDPQKCQCGNGVNQYIVDVKEAGRVEANLTWTPADAVVIVRLMDSSFNTVFATSVANGATARLSHQVTAAGSYRLQLFLSQGGATNATYQLIVTHP